MPLGPEYRLATACVVWPPSESRECAIRDAMADPVDWERFLSMLTRHRITGLARHALTSLPDVAARIPADVRNRLDNDALTLAGENLQMQAETGRLQRLFATSGARVTFLKGVPLAILAYGNLALRHSKDIDIMVSPGEVSPTGRVLEDHGYARVTGPPDLRGSRWQVWLREFYHITYLHRGKAIEVELHWRPLRNRELLYFMPDGIEQRMVRLPDGTDVPTLADEDLFAYLCAHGTLHNWLRLKWLADISALLNQRTALEAERLYECARQRGAGLSAAHAMLFAHRVLHTPLPSALVRRLQAIPGTSSLEASAMKALLDRGFQAEPTVWRRRTKAQYEWHGLRVSGRRNLSAQLRTLLISQDDVQSLALPQGAAFLYPLIRAPRWVWRRIRQTLRPARTPRDRDRR